MAEALESALSASQFVTNPDRKAVWLKDRTSNKWSYYCTQVGTPTITDADKEAWITVQDDGIPQPAAVGVSTDKHYKRMEMPMNDKDVANLENHVLTGGNAGFRACPIKEIRMTSNGSSGNGIEKASGGFFDVLAKTGIESAKKAVPAVLANKATEAGISYLAMHFKDSNPEISKLIDSPGGRAVLGVLLPGITMAACSQFPGTPMAEKLGEVMKAGFDAGMVNGITEVGNAIVFPMAATMLKAAGITGMLGSGGEAPVEEAVPTTEEAAAV